jgi:hypothetical protein
VSGRLPPKEGLPTPVKLIDIEIAQVRNLNVKFVSVWLRRTDPDARHVAYAAHRLERPTPALSFSPSVIRYTRVLSTFWDVRLSFKRLRTTPAKNPRTECCRQPVIFVMAAIDAPAGCLSRSRTAACLVLRRAPRVVVALRAPALIL